MNKKENNRSVYDKKSDEKKGDDEFPGYPLYPPSEDIYNRDKEEQEIDPEDISQLKKDNWENDDDNLDVPGAELDDEEEKVGSEDEENNYYSLGGDEHNDLEEDKGE